MLWHWFVSALVCAEHGPVVLDWTGVAECPAEAEISARLEERVEGRVGEEPALAVTAHVVRSEDGAMELDLTVEFGDAVTHRMLRVGDCDEAIAAMELIASIAVGPGAPSLGREYRGPTAVSAPADAEARASTRAPTRKVGARRVEPRSSSRWGVQAGLGMGVAWGPGPGFAPEPRLRVEITGPAWIMRLGASYTAPTRSAVAHAPGRGAEVGAWRVSVGAGPRFRLAERVGLPLLLEVQAGELVARGYGADRTWSARRTWVAIAGSAGLSVEVHSTVELWTLAELAAPLLRPSFEIRGRGVAHRVPPLAISLATGVSIRWR